MTRPGWIEPSWPAPPGIRALSTSRQGGASVGLYASLNLGDHVGDDPDAVRKNRQWLVVAANLPSTPVWLRQVHGVAVAKNPQQPDCEADAAMTDQTGQVCAVLTADCLPILLCDRRGSRVAAVHAGWRGLAAGIIEATIRHLDVAPPTLLAWLGPAIGPDYFEVGAEVRAAFVACHADAALAFYPTPEGRWLADLFTLARQTLATCGVTAVYGGGLCTASDPSRFFSHRRDRGVTGRMASLIWIESHGGAHPDPRAG
ncbi:MAG: peptidoglycan editing factor PgeF [Pseudomonadota bacterium]